MNPSWDNCIRLAKKTSWLQGAQELAGVRFDVEKAQALKTHIEEEMARIEAIVKPQLPPRKLKKSEEAEWTLPKKPYKLDGTYSALMVRFAERHGITLNSDRTMTLPSGASYPVTGGFLIPVTVPMDLGNAQDMKDWLLGQGWEPTFWNYEKDERGKPKRGKNGQQVRTSPKLQENGKICPSLEEMQGDLIRHLCTWLSYRNRHSVVKGWLGDRRLVLDGNLSAGSSGITNTFRQKHTVVVNVPKNKPHVLVGKEMRELFTAYEGEVLVGFDASALEDRIKGHLTYKYDDGEYARKILADGYDPHQESADLWSIDRSIAKNGNYALGYFCGVPKLASTIRCTPAEAQERYDAYWKLNSALKALDDALGRHWEANGKKYIIGLDGRRVGSRHRHGLVNLAIQSSGSVLMDWAGAWMDKKLGGVKKIGCQFRYLIDGFPASRVLFMHDEYVYSCHPKIAERVARLGEEAIRRAGEFFKLKVPLLSTAQIGHSWADLK